MCIRLKIVGVMAVVVCLILTGCQNNQETFQDAINLEENTSGIEKQGISDGESEIGYI